MIIKRGGNVFIINYTWKLETNTWMDAFKKRAIDFKANWKWGINVREDNCLNKQILHINITAQEEVVPTDTLIEP